MLLFLSFKSNVFFLYIAFGKEVGDVGDSKLWNSRKQRLEALRGKEISMVLGSRCFVSLSAIVSEF